MSPREVAAAARQSIESARTRLRRGDALLVYAEGTRSRTGELQPLLAGVTRYLDSDDVLVLPIGMTGSEALYPVGGETLNPVTVVALSAIPGGQGTSGTRRRRSQADDGRDRLRDRRAAADSVSRCVRRGDAGPGEGAAARDRDLSARRSPRRGA